MTTSGPAQLRRGTAAAGRPMAGARSLRRRHCGAATLLLTLVVLVTVTTITLFVAETVLMEQRMVGNDVRAIRAFETAAAGIGFAVGYLRLPGADPTAVLTGAVGTGSYSVTLAELGGNRFELHATGQSGDGTARRDIVRRIAFQPFLPNPPPTPLTTRTAVQLTGNLTIVNNHRPFTIWSGQTVTAAGSAATRIRAGGVDGVVSSSVAGLGPDVIQNDPNLNSLSADDLFESFFDRQRQSLRESCGDTVPTDGAGGVLICHPGDLRLDGHTSLGSPEDPVILWVEGDLTTAGSIELYGVVFIDGDWKAGGTVTVHGGVIVGGELAAGSGSQTLIFDPQVIERTEAIGEMAGEAGSWKDWS